MAEQEHWRRPTVRQVAEAAGVSTATVSNALNGTGRLSEATRRRVLAAARDLSYLPYNSVRAQARGGTGVLGLTMTTYGDLAVPYPEVPYYGDLILGAIQAANEHGYLLVVLPSSMSSWNWLTTPLDGVIHCEPRVHDPVAAILERRGIPLVNAGRPLAPRRTDAWVDTDDDRATRELLGHLHSAGARRIAAVLPAHDDAYPVVVRRAYQSWCEEHGQPAVVASFAVADYPIAEYAAIERVLSTDPPVDAVFGIYNDSGARILEVARRHGLEVPADLAVACFSDDPAYAGADPPVTTVSLRPRAVGAAAVDLLTAVLNGRRGLERQQLVPTELQVRASTGGLGAGA